MIEVGIIGATGYVGIELVRLLLSHANVKKIHISSQSFEGQQIEDIYPALRGFVETKCEGKLLSADEVLAASDLVFTALPHGVAEQYATQCVNQGKKLIDLSADFRFGTDEETFKKWYKSAWKFPTLHAEAVYGLPEMNRARIAQASIVGNPGCYVTSATLALLPAIKADFLKMDTIIIDGKSGISGAGRNPSATNHFCESGEAFAPYAVGSHRHQPEIERNLLEASSRKYSVVFTPHLIPMSRGIMSTCYAPFAEGKNRTIEEIHSLYTDFYRNEPFVRILPLGKTPSTKNVRLSNFCDISVHVVQEGRMLQVCSALDNMIKGASGQAIQNMNILFGFLETEGISAVPPSF